MRLTAAFLAAVAAGVFAFLAIRAAYERGRSSVAVAPPAAVSAANGPVQDVDTSYVLRVLRHGRADADAMAPLLLSPRVREVPSAGCPDHLVVLSSVEGDGYAGPIRDCAAALGDLGLAAKKDRKIAVDAMGGLEATWAALRKELRGDPSDPPLRVLVMHYPRPELPGRCVTLEVTFYTFADPYLDLRPQDHKRGLNLPGHVLHLRKTLQLAQGAPRVVEALIETQTGAFGGPRRLHLPQLTRDPALIRMTDVAAGGHFHRIGGGRRRGLVWYDLSLGLAEAQEYAQAYRILVPRGGRVPQVEIESLEADTQRRLLDLLLKL